MGSWGKKHSKEKVEDSSSSDDEEVYPEQTKSKKSKKYKKDVKDKGKDIVAPRKSHTRKE